MSVDKQIKDMAQILKDYTKKKNIMASYVILEDYAEVLYNEGYCKASEVIDEFANSLKDFLHDAPVVYQAWFRAKIDNFADRFKKKYKSEETINDSRKN